MNRIFFIFFLLCSGTFACTTSPVVYTDKAPDTEFTDYQTYAYLPSGEKDDETQTIYTQKIIEEVNQEMEARGYTLDNENPDLLVNVKTMFEEEQDIQRVPLAPAYDYYSPGFYSPTTLSPYYYTGYATIPRVTGYGIREVEYTEGTFVVDIIETDNNRIIWRGWSETPVDRTNLTSSVRAYIDNIFEEFPVEPQESQP